MLLEVAANSVASAIAARDGGAGRVELCASLAEGGVTPSHATITMAREAISLPLYILVRPRAGDFVYASYEWDLMLADVAHCRQLGCDGVVVGALDDAGRVHPRCRELVEAAGPMGATFHRAIDVCADPVAAVDDVIATGCERILTSGSRAHAHAGASIIRAMASRAAGRVAIMAGAGVTSGNITELVRLTGLSEFHASAKQRLPSRQPKGVGLSMDGGEWRTDEAEVAAIVQALAELHPKAVGGP
jgi:copper homeostasis protein